MTCPLSGIGVVIRVSFRSAGAHVGVNLERNARTSPHSVDGRADKTHVSAVHDTPWTDQPGLWNCSSSRWVERARVARPPDHHHVREGHRRRMNPGPLSGRKTSLWPKGGSASPLSAMPR
jgi:hypothetical protein